MNQKVLVVDDSATARLIIKRCLEIAGFAQADFVEADNGRQALSVVAQTKVDLLVTDLNMPDMDGRSLLKNIKKNTETATLPVIIVSSVSNEALSRDLLSEGAYAVISKPVSPVSISRTIKDLTDTMAWGSYDG